MLEPVFLGFDFGLKRIGVAVGQHLTGCARPLATMAAVEGRVNPVLIDTLLQTWDPAACVVGLPTKTDGQPLYVTQAAREFGLWLHRYSGRIVHWTDERLTTVEVRSRLFDMGGYRKIKSSQIDSLAACLILEQWLQGYSA